jgi:hypothetical protein
MQVMRGHTLWDYDPETKVLIKAEYETVVDTATNQTIRKVITKTGHDYFQALNKKNAAKKIAKAYRSL